MAELFHFPSPRERSWQVFERTLRDCIRRAGASDAMVDWILGDLGPRFDACQGELDIEFPTQTVPKVAELSAFMHEMMNRAIFQMVLLEIELYAAKFNA